MKEISYQMALYLFAGNQTEVYMLFDEDGSEGLAENVDNINLHHNLKGIFGIEE